MRPDTMIRSWKRRVLQAELAFREAQHAWGQARQADECAPAACAHGCRHVRAVRRANLAIWLLYVRYRRHLSDVRHQASTRARRRRHR